MHKEGRENIKRFVGAQKCPCRFAPVIYSLNYSNHKYLYVDEGCFDLSGYTAKQWIAESINGYLSKSHSAHFKIMDIQVFPDNISFLQTLAIEPYQI